MNIIIDVMNLQEKQLRHYYRKNKNYIFITSLKYIAK